MIAFPSLTKTNNTTLRCLRGKRSEPLWWQPKAFKSHVSFSRNSQCLVLHYPSCLGKQCFWPSAGWRSSRPGSRVQTLLCAGSLWFRSECQIFCFGCVCMYISVSSCLRIVGCTCVCMCVCVSEGCQPCPELLSVTPPVRCGTKRPLRKWEKVFQCRGVCTLFNASLTAVGYERGLVLLEQMAEC